MGPLGLLKLKCRLAKWSTTRRVWQRHFLDAANPVNASRRFQWVRETTLTSAVWPRAASLVSQVYNGAANASAKAM